MKKKIILLLAAILMLCIATVSFAGTTLTDIEGTKYEEAVNCLAKLEIINGYQDATFRPENKITRAEIAKILLIAKGEKVDTSKVNNTYFEDVTSEHWALAYVNAAYENKLIEGYEDKTFRPDEEVTYAEAITMVIRMLGYKSNVEMSTKAWPDNYIAKAKSLKILKNVNYENHNDDAIRGDVANLVWDALSVEKRYTTAGILEEVKVEHLAGVAITIDGETYTLDPKTSADEKWVIEDCKDGAIFYTLTKSLEKDEVKFISGLPVALIKTDTFDDYVVDKEGEEVLFKKRGIEEFGEEFEDEFEDYIFVGLTYDRDEEKVVDIDLIAVNEDITAKAFKKFDRVYVDTLAEIAYIVSGMPEIE